ncbi:MAG: hypothetical protein IJ545_05395 [Alphaproteobacteria bacterium]|nr:hypothetical protein [Alphaproteobacteria bacterium]
MKILRKIACFVSILGSLTACQTTDTPVDNKPEVNTSVQIEQPKGHLNVETSVARALKYNQNNIKKVIEPKFLGDEARQNAFANLRKLREGQNPGLAVSLKELDFAILYTTTNYAQHPDKVDMLLTQATAQNLTLGTIKAYKSALYAHKKNFEIQRKIRQYEKQLETLAKKQQKSFSDNDLAYKNKLEEMIDNLTQIKQTLAQNSADFRQLVKIDAEKIELNGNSFYNKISLPPQSSADPYLQNAFDNRFELMDFPNFSLEDIDKKITSQYPDNSSSVKGFYIQDTAYQQNLSARADAQASVLLQTMLDYQKAGRSKKNTLRPKLSEELHKAIYLQTETAYQLASRISADYDMQQINLKERRQNIRSLEKVSRPTPKQKLDLLQAKLDLLINENLADQILAEKAMTITALQFYGGQIFITPDFSQKNLSDMSAGLNKAFESKLSARQKTSAQKTFSQKNKESDLLETNQNDWAHKENWLEDLMTSKAATSSQKIMSRPREESTDYNAKKTLQLGSFLDKESAAEYWLKISKEFTVLQKYQPFYQKTSVAGIPLFRLIITSPNGGFKNICISLRRRNYECILRD